MTNFRALPGLPPYGPPARAFPPEWGERGQEGTVVAFDGVSGTWVGNLACGREGLTAVLQHPDGRRVLVLARGVLWCVDPDTAAVELLLEHVEEAWPVTGPAGYVVNWQGLAFARFGPTGLLWHSRRLIWDGFRSITIAGNRLTGEAWSPVDAQEWFPFELNLSTGASSGGAYNWEHPAADRWEQLATGDGATSGGC